MDQENAQDCAGRWAERRFCACSGYPICGLDDKDSQAQAAIRDTKRGMFASGELNRVAGLLEQAAIRAEDEEQWIGLARWVVYSRLATAIALIYGHDPEQDWVQAAILTSIDSTPVQEELKGEAKGMGSHNLGRSISKSW